MGEFQKTSTEIFLLKILYMNEQIQPFVEAQSQPEHQATVTLKTCWCSKVMSMKSWSQLSNTLVIFNSYAQPSTLLLTFLVVCHSIRSGDVGVTFVAASTVAPSLRSSATTSTWPSLDARWRAFNPFCIQRNIYLYAGHVHDLGSIWGISETEYVI